MDTGRILSQLLGATGKQVAAPSPTASQGTDEEDVFGPELALALAQGLAVPSRSLDPGVDLLAEAGTGAGDPGRTDGGKGSFPHGIGKMGWKAAVDPGFPARQKGAPAAGTEGSFKAGPGGGMGRHTGAPAASADQAGLHRAMASLGSASSPSPGATVARLAGIVAAGRPKPSSFEPGDLQLMARAGGTAFGAGAAAVGTAASVGTAAAADRGLRAPVGKFGTIPSTADLPLAPLSGSQVPGLSHALIEAIRLAGATAAANVSTAAGQTEADGIPDATQGLPGVGRQGAAGRTIANDLAWSRAADLQPGAAATRVAQPPSIRLDRATGTVQLQVGAEAGSVQLASPLPTEAPSPSTPAQAWSQPQQPQAQTQHGRSAGRTNETSATEGEARAIGANGQQPSQMRQAEATAAEAPIARAPLPIPDDTLDPTLQLRFVPGGARIAMQAPGNGELTVHLDIREGVADLRVGGAAAWLVGANVEELRVALAQEGLTLGKLDQPEGGFDAPGGERQPSGGGDQGHETSGGEPRPHDGSTSRNSIPSTQTAVLCHGAGRHHVEA